MSSLKEEIAETLFDSMITLTPEYISKHFIKYKDLDNEDEKFLVRKKADLVLKVIKKRIDNIINTTTRYEKGEWINFYKGFDEAIFKVKEMLK